jgi:hypothetical protein
LKIESNTTNTLCIFLEHIDHVAGSLGAGVNSR